MFGIRQSAGLRRARQQAAVVRHNRHSVQRQPDVTGDLFQTYFFQKNADRRTNGCASLELGLKGPSQPAIPGGVCSDLFLSVAKPVETCGARCDRWQPGLLDERQVMSWQADGQVVAQAVGRGGPAADPAFDFLQTDTERVTHRSQRGVIFLPRRMRTAPGVITEGSSNRFWSHDQLEIVSFCAAFLP